MVSKKKKKYQDITATATRVLRNRSVSLGTADAASKNGEVSSSDSDGDRSSQIMDDVVRSNMMVDEVDQPNKNEGDVPIEQPGKDNRDSEGMVLKTYSSRKRKGKVNQLIDVGDGPSKEKKSAQFVPYAGDSSIPVNEKILPEVIKKRKGNRKKGGYGKNSAITDHSIDDIVVNNDDIIAKSIGETIAVAKPTVSASPVVFFKSSTDGSYNEVDVNLVAAAENAVKLFKNDGFRESIIVPDDFSQFTLGGDVTLMNMQDNNSGDNDNVVPGIKSVTKEGVETSDGQGNTDNKTPRAWVNPNVTFADFLKQNKDEEELKMEFIPPVLMSNGQKRVVFSAEEVKKGGSAFSLQLYGYFIGTSMDYRVVNAHLRRMWWRYDLKEIVKTAAGFYLCKFKSEKGMKEVLESGPWLVNNVPFFVNQWEPGVWLEKIEPEKVPIWICIHNIPIELWSGRSIGKLVSGIGRPMLMDKVTSERCLSKSGRLGFARVLTEVNANDDLPSFVEFSYPVIGSFPAKVGKLEVTYQWKPPSCTHCKVFGHSFNTCKIRPKTEDEVSAQVLKDALKINNDGETVDLNNQCVEDGFKVVGKKGRVFQKLNFDNNKSQRQSTEAKGIKQNAVKNNYGIKDNIDVEETDWNVESQKSQNHNVLRKGDKGKGIDGEGNNKTYSKDRIETNNPFYVLVDDESNTDGNTDEIIIEESINDKFDDRWNLRNSEKKKLKSYLDKHNPPGKEVIDQWQPHEFKYFRTQWIAAGFGNFDKDGMVIGD